jgi:hypothetical protein
VKRREFITLVAAAVPFGARAQQSPRIRRIGMIMPAASDDSEYPIRIGAFLQEMQQLGWMMAGASRRISRHASFTLS